MTIKLRNDLEMPLIGLGTWKLRGEECVRTVKSALDLGYRHIDTAHAYENHQAIAKAIRGFDRNSLFLTSKLSMDQMPDKKVEQSVEKAISQALNELGTDYLDLYLIHWPDRTKPMDAILDAMQHMSEKGALRSIGVSNFTIHHLQDVMRPNIHIAVNQVEFHPYLYQKVLWDFCKKNGIEIVSYRPLGKGELVDDPVIKEIGKKHGKTAAQTILKWLVQKGIVTIPKASKASHLKENIDIFDFTLTDAEMKELDGLNRNYRFCDGDWTEFNY